MKPLSIAVIAAGLTLLSIAGCAKPSDAEIARMMRQPPRPVALDRLDAMIGDLRGALGTRSSA